ncbi:glutathione S-transferase family protein [Marinomonas sp. 15G1-11]|uniref:Glutathione S-transferase family protein n=1 Tax=Marinomonas phaeophyticola TaxID=3004091 RepID=A0ABT4JYQ9_9GAMM|nr:glutathione S-transferase family protein [Marinomonas sp. 15G1-11]MCZ2723356.1 glutathione S-transferase family protein [Marinomonas sp. 15G1-11]
MGLIVDGKWVDQWYSTKDSKGNFERQESRFRHAVSSEEGSLYQAESGRYHLYVSLACPWAHRTLIFRILKGLEKHISVSVVKAEMLENGWEFGDQGDPLFHLDYVYQLYLQAAPDYEGRVTVPILWDKKTNTIVNNESSDIIRILNSSFNAITENDDDYYPVELRSEIDSVNERIYNTVNNGVYRAGFATTQEAYDMAYHELFDSLDWLEDRLSKQRYLVGDRLTEADWRLFTTLIRFDAVYHGHFKCNRNKLSEFENLSNYLRELFQISGVAATVDLDYSKRHYYASHKTINPTGVVPLGPLQSFDVPHNRASLFL